MPVLLKKPTGTGGPLINGGAGDSATGATLICSPGRWGADLLGEHLYRAPARLAYRWTKSGTPVSGAAARTYTPHTAGPYRCVVTASNTSGSTSQSSAVHAVWAPRPDTMIKKDGAPSGVGNNVYNSTGEHQTILAKAKRGKTVTFDIRVQNDASNIDSFKIKGTGQLAGFTVRYLAGTRGTTDITNAVIHGTYTLRNLGAGASRSLRLVVTVKRGTAVGTTKTWSLVARSTHDSTRLDTAKAKTKAVG